MATPVFLSSGRERYVFVFALRGWAENIVPVVEDAPMEVDEKIVVEPTEAFMELDETFMELDESVVSEIGVSPMELD